MATLHTNIGGRERKLSPNVFPRVSDLQYQTHGSNGIQPKGPFGVFEPALQSMMADFCNPQKPVFFFNTENYEVHNSNLNTYVNKIDDSASAAITEEIPMFFNNDFNNNTVFFNTALYEPLYNEKLNNLP